MSNGYMDFLQQTMDYSAVKRKTNADNIANLNTPDFKATKVLFDNLLDEQVRFSSKKTHERHIPIGTDAGKPELVKDYSTKERYDGNNVDLNEEMVEMIKNNHLYSVTVQAINKEFALNRTAIGKQ